MKSLRANLFLSVGCVLLVIALLSFLLPRMFIHKDINTASSYLTKVYTSLMKKVDYLSRSWVTYRFVHTAAQLNAVTQTLQVDKKSLWEEGTSILSQDPSLSLIQISNAENTEVAVITPEGGKLYTPSWKKDDQEKLWIKIPEKEGLYRAEPIHTLEKKGVYYALFPTQEESENRPWIPFEDATSPPQFTEPASDIYKALSEQENMLFQKVEMISLLAPLKEKAEGMLFVNTSFKKGMAILAEDIFSTKLLVDPTKFQHSPFLIVREEGPYVDLSQVVQKTDARMPTIVIGYSLSEIAAEISNALQRPVVLSFKEIHLQAFTPLGTFLSLKELTEKDGNTVWQGQEYIPFKVPLLELTFTILIPKAQKTAIIDFLNKIRDALVAKISVNLLTVALVLLALALAFLARISKRITKPITQLALASQEIGKGKYDGLHLPPAEKRHDEVATLTHSFQQMVVSLRDREKIRGVLNKVVSKEIASKILTSNVELGGEIRRLTMLFSDIRSFTPLSETLSPQKLIGMLNSYMTRMCRVVDETHGVVDKFVGDEIMALYGAPVDLEDHAQKALEAAVAMIHELQKWNQERGDKEPQIRVGIGVHTGDAFAGNMGAEDRLNYTVVGANVNLASRLCSVAKPMQVLISEETYKALSDPSKFHFEKLPPVTLKGIDHPIPIYSVHCL